MDYTRHSDERGMTNEQNALLVLVRTGLKEMTGGEVAECGFTLSGLSQHKLQCLAHEQGVTGIAWTGYERLHGKLAPDGQLASGYKLQWFASAQGVERATKSLFERAAEFAGILRREGNLNCVVLKGIDYAQLYPPAVLP